MADLRVSFPKPCDEPWEAMVPAGCARVCARCDKAVHDLSLHTLDEAEALLRADPDTCVRARIDADGVVALKPGRRGDARRMVIAAAASAGLLAAAPAFARQDRPAGAIAGTIETFGIRMRVTATGTDGQAFRARINGNGRFRLRHLPAGTYTLTFVPTCGDSWRVDNVVVGAGETRMPNVQHMNNCIVVGLLRVEDPRA
jgi:Carboxypeptidase regulatory-like domain